jgi:hypothetical protein
MQKHTHTNTHIYTHARTHTHIDSYNTRTHTHTRTHRRQGLRHHPLPHRSAVRRRGLQGHQQGVGLPQVRGGVVELHKIRLFCLLICLLICLFIPPLVPNLIISPLYANYFSITQLYNLSNAASQEERLRECVRQGGDAAALQLQAQLLPQIDTIFHYNTPYSITHHICSYTPITTYPHS